MAKLQVESLTLHGHRGESLTVHINNVKMYKTAVLAMAKQQVFLPLHWPYSAAWADGHQQCQDVRNSSAGHGQTTGISNSAFAIFCGMGINNVKMYETAVLAMAKQQVFLTVPSPSSAAWASTMSRCTKQQCWPWPNNRYF
jgi:hypothetical protein